MVLGKKDLNIDNSKMIFFYKGNIFPIFFDMTRFFSVIFFKFVVQNMDGIGPYFKELDVLAPAFALAMIVGFVVSKLFPPKFTSETKKIP